MDDSLLPRIDMARTTMRPAEAQVAAVILAKPDWTLAASTSQLAEAAGVSPATVVRFCRALGMSGYRELRTELARDLSRRTLELERSSVAEGTITLDDSLTQMITKIAFHEARTIENTARAVDADELEAVASAISIAPRTALFGVGSSGLVASDLSEKLERIGLVCQHHQDTHMQLVHAALCKRPCVALGISFSGNTQEVVEALTVAQKHGATTVAMTGLPDSPVGRLADHVLVTSARETQVRAGAMSSRMAQLAVVDFLFARVAQLCMDDLETLLSSTSTAVSTHRKSLT